MRRHLPRLLLTGALLSPMSLYALGLGEIRLTSALNQPFDAEIELLSPTSEELSSLKVSLASNELFARYGIDRPAYLSNLNFAVSRSREGRATIKVSSNRSVTEPFVTILVEASWARGRLLREYTVLLDPPTFMPSQEAPAPVTSAQSGAQNEGRIERQPAAQAQPEQPATEPTPTRPTPTREAAPSEPIARTSATAGSEYTVQRNDTLWRIASSANPGSRRVVNQTMIALFRANSAAFDGNINRLRAGSVLRIPDLAEIETVSTTDASAEVARQTAEWSGAAPTQSTAEADRLRLVTPAETPVAPSAAAPATQTQPAQQRPGATAPGATAAPDKRLEVQNPGLADVQRNADKTPTQPPAVESQQPAAEQPSQATETPPAAEQPTPAAKPPVKPAVEEPAGPSLMERIGDFWWVPVVLGLLVVIGLVLAFIRRRREEASESLDSLSTLNFEPRVAAPAAAATAVAGRGRDRAGSFLVEDEDEQESADDFVEPPPVTARRTEAPRTRPVDPLPEPTATPKADDTLSSETAVRFDQQDALAEADFHMAYGLYDQAADLVKIAIDREPARRELKLKLLEIYFVWGNKELFLDTARDLHGLRETAAAGEWDKVLIMGKQIAPDDAMFKGEAGATRVDLVDVNLEGGENRVDVDLFAEPDANQPAGLDLEFTTGEHRAPTDEQTQLAESDLDFLLDEPKHDADDEPTREIDPLARTQETPTIESPMIDRSAQTLREKTDKAFFAKQGIDQTAELSLDDLGLDVDSLEHTGSLEDTTSLEKDTGDTEVVPPLRDDEMTQLAPSISSFDRTMEAPRVEKFDIESTGTIYIDQVDLGGGDTVEQQRPDVDSTASMQRLGGLHDDVDLDLDNLSGGTESPETTVRHPSRSNDEMDQFTSDVFTERTSEVPRIDLDVGEPLSADDHEPTNKQITNEMELSELEPVTMSEVGTKLDLARAYMDMGDPDGARSILEEVLAEGNPNQKQEAQRLIESIR
jgi:pilus assembly protein FimV